MGGIFLTQFQRIWLLLISIDAQRFSNKPKFLQFQYAYDTFLINKGVADIKKRGNDTHAILTSLTSIYLAVILGVYLLYPGFGGYQNITEEKWKVFFPVSALYIFLVIIIRVQLAIVGSCPLTKPITIWKHLNLTHKFMIGYLLLTAASTVQSVYPFASIWGGERFDGLITIALYVIVFLLVSTYAQPARWMLWLFACAISLNCILALIQFGGYNPLRLYPDGMNYYDANVKYAGEFLGTLGNADIFSAVISLCVPAYIAALHYCKNVKSVCLLLISALLCLLVLLRSFVAAGILGVIGGVAFSVPVLMKKKRKLAIVLLAALLLATAVVVYFFGREFGGFLYEASELMHGNWDDTFGSGRIYIWRNVIELIPERPLLGGGPATLGLRTNAAFERFDEQLGILIHSEIDTAHNEYLNIIVNQGIPACFCYICALFASACRWIRSARTDCVAAICGCAVLGYSIQAFFGISSPISSPYLWIALALLNPIRISVSTDKSSEGRKT